MISHSESLKLLEYGNSREGNKEAIVDLLTDYLQADLEVKERVWSWWHLVDNLAMLRRCGDAVTQQENYLKWAISSNLASQFILVQFCNLANIRNCTTR
jgi:hypothetical protein